MFPTCTLHTTTCDCSPKVISPIAKVDLPAGQWPGLIEYVCALHGSERHGDREVAAYLLNAVADAAAVSLTSNFSELFELFQGALQDPVFNVVSCDSEDL